MCYNAPLNEHLLLFRIPSLSRNELALNQSINQRFYSATHGQGEATSQHSHRGQETLRHEVPQAWGAVKARIHFCFVRPQVRVEACGEMDGQGREIEEVARGDAEVEISEGAKQEAEEERERLATMALKMQKAGEEEELQLESNLEAID